MILFKFFCNFLFVRILKYLLNFGNIQCKFDLELENVDIYMYDSEFFLWVLSKFNISLFLLEPWHRAGALLERAVPWRQQDAGDQLREPLGRQEGVDQGGARLPAQTYV